MTERKPIREMTDIERLRLCAADYGRYSISDGVFLLKIAKDFERLKELIQLRVPYLFFPNRTCEGDEEQREAWVKEMQFICAKESEATDD